MIGGIRNPTLRRLVIVLALPIVVPLGLLIRMGEMACEVIWELPGAIRAAW